MKKTLLGVIPFLLLLNGCAEPTGSSSNNELVVFADSLFQSSLDSGMIAGGAALVMQNGELLLDKSYGFASLELDAPMPEHAGFEIGSVTKQFTAAAILKLQEMGKLSLDDDFTEYLDFDTRGRTISIRRLLDHTSGIPGYTEMEAFWPFSLHTYPRDSLVRMVEAEDFLFEPGEALIYNNSAYYFLGLIIEALADTTYEAFLQEQFFGPLGMDHTYYCSNSRVVKDKAYGYDLTPEGLRQKGYLDHTWPYAAGSLCSTTEDLLKWMRALHGGQVLSPESYQMMITPGTLNDGASLRYAMGLANFNNKGHVMLEHGGGINGFLSETRYFPDDDLFVICLVNTTGPHGGTFFADQLTWYLLAEEDTPVAPIDVDLAALEGTYSGRIRGRLFSTVVGALPDGLTLLNDNAETPDTLRHYLGDHTWLDGTERIRIRDGKIHVDQVYGHYLFRRE